MKEPDSFRAESISSIDFHQEADSKVKVNPEDTDIDKNKEFVAEKNIVTATQSPDKLQDGPLPPDNVEDEVNSCVCHQCNRFTKWITSLYVQRPGIFLIVFGALFVVVLVLTLAFNLFRMNPPSDRDYLVWDDIMTYKLD